MSSHGAVLRWSEAPETEGLQQLGLAGFLLLTSKLLLVHHHFTINLEVQCLIESIARLVARYRIWKEGKRREAWPRAWSCQKLRQQRSCNHRETSAIVSLGTSDQICSPIIYWYFCVGYTICQMISWYICSSSPRLFLVLEASSFLNSSQHQHRHSSVQYPFTMLRLSSQTLLASHIHFAPCHRQKRVFAVPFRSCTYSRSADFSAIPPQPAHRSLPASLLESSH